jgi:phosphoribosylaminoimidazole-succinocarboxamide synthase
MSDTDFFQGKVKTVFNTSEPDKVIIQYEDKVTAGNGRKVDFPEGKGEVCCEISSLLFQKLEKYNIRTHYVSMPTHKAMCCKRVDIIPIEVVVRNVAAGSIVRQTTLEEGRIFNWPLVEYYLKDDEKDDPLLTEDRIRLMGDYPLRDLEQIAREVNAILSKTFREIGLTLVDFKLEFGYDANKDILLADELSPDGMRLWKDGKSFDKDLFRKEEGDIVEAYKYILSQLKEL